MIVGGGPTGVEVAGALADMVQRDGAGGVPRPRHDRRAHLPDRPRRRAAKAVLRQGPRLRGQGSQGRKVSTSAWAPASRRSGPGHARLSNGTVIATRCVIWGGGIIAAAVAADCGLAAGTRRTRRRAARPDARRPPRRLRRRRHRQHLRPRRRGAPAARLGGAAERQDRAAENILADFDGKPRIDVRLSATRGSWR